MSLFGYHTLIALIHSKKAKENLKANYKETDLFKVFQTGELALADTADNSSGMVNLIALRNAVYSPEFRRIVSKITGVNDLIERVDCSANAVRTSECKFHLPTRFYSVLQYAHSMQTVAISSVTMTSSGRVECLT